MNTGHGGTLSTLHADSALDALDRLADMALSARTISISNSSGRRPAKQSICSLLRTRFHGPAPGARADHREGIQPCGAVLRDGGNLPGFLQGCGVIEQMETRIGGTAMTSLLGHGGTNGTSPLCALLSIAAPNFRRANATRDTALSPDVRQRRRWIWFAGHCTDGIAGSGGVCMVQCESPRINSSLARSLLRA